MHIPICDPKQEYLAHQDEIDAAIRDALESGHYILGPSVTAFETEMAAYLGCKHAAGVNSGTDALHLALRALDIGPGDQVITTPFTFIATTEAIGMVGATPVFADIDPRTFNIDPACIAKAVTPHTKAIMPVHLFGQPCEMDAIMAIAKQHNLYVIEDCAQAIGASYRKRKVGTLGTIGCFSFFPTKNLSCFGDGGMVVTNDTRVHERVEMLRRHGGKVKYHHSHLGLNSRLDELQAATLRIKLRHLERRNAARRRLADRYHELLERASGVQRPTEITSLADPSSTRLGNDSDLIEAVYHQYTVLVDDRDAFRYALTAADIGTAIYYPVPLHLQEVHRDLNLHEGTFPHAEYVSRHCVSLPMYPELESTQLEYIAATIREADEMCGAGSGNQKVG